MANENGKTVMVQGRIVWVSGNLFTGKIKTEFASNIPKVNKSGEKMKEYGFGLAVPKSILNQVGPGQPGEIWAAIHEEAYTLYPSRQLPPSFAMKYKDGDGIDDKGVSFTQREGYAGHIVLSCTTSLPIKFFRFENGQNILINDGIKCGDYVNVQLTVKAHVAIGQGKAGLYLNPNAVQFLYCGKEIINTPSGDQIFGLSAPAVPQGASMTPIAMPGMLIPQQAPAMPGYAQAPMAPAMPVQPHYGVLPPQHQVQQVAPVQQAPMMPPQHQVQQVAPVQQAPMMPPQHQVQQVAPVQQAPMMPPQHQVQQVAPVQQAPMMPPQHQVQQVAPVQQAPMMPQTPNYQQPTAPQGFPSFPVVPQQ